MNFLLFLSYRSVHSCCRYGLCVESPELSLQQTALWVIIMADDHTHIRSLPAPGFECYSIRAFNQRSPRLYCRVTISLVRFTLSPRFQPESVSLYNCSPMLGDGDDDTSASPLLVIQLHFLQPLSGVQRDQMTKL